MPNVWERRELPADERLTLGKVTVEKPHEMVICL
jgi:hypothetical protein